MARSVNPALILLIAILPLFFNIGTGSSLVRSLSKQCGGVLKGKTGQFQSPQYPANYPENVECSWKIMVPPGNNKKIVITFPKLDVEWGNNCMFDYVQILDQNQKPFGIKICGRKYDLKIEVPGTTAYVVLHSDEEATEQGFRATFEVISPPKPPSKGDCDFDSGFCNDWIHDMVDGNFKWTIGNGTTPTFLTGPQNDHSGKGNYLFIESSLPRKEGDKARIISTSLRGPRCLRVYYHMYGLVGMGSLRVYLRDASGNDTLIWSRHGDQGRKWREAQLPIPVNSSSPFQIVIEGVVGKGDYSDIAIDDIAFSSEACQVEECGGKLSGLSGTFFSPDFPDKYPDDSRCSWTIRGPPGTKNIIVKFLEFYLEVDTKCSKDHVKIFNKDGKQVGLRYCGFYPEGYGVKIQGDTARLDFSSNHVITRSGFNATFEAVLSESPDDCDFDAAKCLWNNSDADDFDWTIKDGRTPSFFTGPSADYLGLGHYAYVESSYRQKGDTAHLVSGVMSRARCMQFMFNLHGIQMGEINVFQQRQDGSQPKRLLTKAGNHERHWHKAWVNISDVGGPYRIIIEGVVGGGFTSDAAIDEISFTPGLCPSETNTCGGYLTSISGDIQSPNFPYNYPNNASCIWVINPFPYYNQLDIVFKDFNVENSSSCSKDNVQIADAHRTRIGEKHCGLLKDMAQKTVHFQRTKAYVSFFSDSDSTKKGFRATYQVSQSRQICGGRLSGTSGNFSSPNYPHNYTSDEVCEWEITGLDTNKWLEITFRDFVIDDTVVCYYNYLLVYDVLHGNEIGRYCGMHSPAAIIIPSHVTDIRFATSQYGAARGFVAEWRVIKPNNAQNGENGRK